MNLGKMLIMLGIVVILFGCAAKAWRHGDYMKVWGFGSKGATWEYEDGSKFSIERGEPIKVPEFVPYRG